MEQQRHKVLGEIKAIIEQEHQQLIGKVVIERTTAADLPLARRVATDSTFFALLLQIEKSGFKLWQEFLKGMNGHASGRQKDSRLASQFAVKVHR